MELMKPVAVMKYCKQLLKDSDYCILEVTEIYNHTDAKEIACLRFRNYFRNDPLVLLVFDRTACL